MKQICIPAALCIPAPFLSVTLEAADAPAGTTAVASSSRHADPSASAKAGTVQCMGIGKIPLVVGDANAALDGDRTTLWWSKEGGEQEFTIDLGHPVEVRSVQIEWGENFPADYEIQWTKDGGAWKTAFTAKDFQNTFRGKSRTEFKAGWTYHKIEPPVTTGALRIRCLKGKGDGYQIFDVFLNECCPFSYEPVPRDALYRDSDRTEMHDLATEKPEILRDLVHEWTRIDNEFKEQGGYNKPAEPAGARKSGSH
jgi:hypothetical protein